LDDSARNGGEIFEATAFLHHFKDLTDTRQPAASQGGLSARRGAAAGTARHPRRGGGLHRYCALWREALLRRFRPFKDGPPPHDRIGDIVAMLDAEQFQRCFVAWVASVAGIPEGVIAIDGKTVRRSGRKRDDTLPIRMVSAFAARQRLVLGQIIAIPKLLAMLAIVTIDAIGCQRDIARTIIDKKADYVLALKGNQESLRQDVELFATCSAPSYAAIGGSSRHSGEPQPAGVRDPHRLRHEPAVPRLDSLLAACPVFEGHLKPWRFAVLGARFSPSHLSRIRGPPQFVLLWEAIDLRH
jgi:hypothetical protein